MSNKTNNLKAYLRDLYEGIVSKKPDASRNPQNFRSEIEAIRTGGELYEVMDASELPEDAPNGSLALVEGEPIPEAYTVSSVAELPSNAVDGSLAVVESDSIIGKYRWNETLDFDALNLPTHDEFENGTQPIDVHIYSLDTAGAGLGEWFRFYKEDGAVCLYLQDTLLYNESYGWDDSYTQVQLLSEVLTVSNITMSDEGFDITIEDFITWFNQSTERLSGGYSLYTHENGQWVYKCEVV